MAGDPLGGFTLEPRHYRILTERLRERMPGVPIVGTLEGGYIPGGSRRAWRRTWRRW